MAAPDGGGPDFRSAGCRSETTSTDVFASRRGAILQAGSCLNKFFFSHCSRRGLLERRPANHRPFQAKESAIPSRAPARTENVLRCGGSQQSKGPDRKAENTPEAAAAAHTNGTGSYLHRNARAGGQRAATASATARRAKRAANATTVAPSSPTGAGSSDRAAPARASTCFAMAVALLCACSKRRRGVHTVPLLACSIRRAALKINAAARKHSPRRLDWFNLGTVRCTVQNPRRHLYAFIRGAPPDAPDRQQKYFF